MNIDTYRYHGELTPEQAQSGVNFLLKTGYVNIDCAQLTTGNFSVPWFLITAQRPTGVKPVFFNPTRQCLEVLK